MKKLTLNKEVIVNLCSKEMDVFKGLSGGGTCTAGACETMICPPPTLWSACICQ